jgi:hypothetical protein
MVGSGGASASEAAQLDRLEDQAAHGGGGSWEYLCLVRRLKVRRSEPVLRFGLSLLNDPKARSKLGSEGNARIPWNRYMKQIYSLFRLSEN